MYGGMVQGPDPYSCNITRLNADELKVSVHESLNKATFRWAHSLSLYST